MVKGIRQILDYSQPYRQAKWGFNASQSFGSDDQAFVFHTCPMCQSRNFENADGTGYKSALLASWVTGSRCRHCGWWSLEKHHIEEDSPYEHHEQLIGELVTYSIDSLEVPVHTLVSHLNLYKEDLASIHPRKFEELVEGIFREHFNCSVELTKQTRDGGKDLVCMNAEKGKFYVELKRHHLDNKVGIAIVQRFVGVLYQDQVANGLIVTSSTFSNAAIEAARRASHTPETLNLELRDINDLLSWLDVFQTEIHDFNEFAARLFPDIRFDRKSC